MSVPTRPKILVIEDNPICQQLAAIKVAELGYDVALASNGSDGIAIVEENPNFDAILLDLEMPVMNGREFIAQIRKNPTLANHYIIVVSAHAFPNDIYEILKAGANDYIVKPYRLEDLDSAIAKAVDNNP